MWPYFDIESAAEEVSGYPRYKELFSLLDELKITSLSDVDEHTISHIGQVEDYSKNPLGRSFLSEIIKESFVYVYKKHHQKEISVKPEVRLVASSKNQDAINTSALLSDNSVTVFDGEVRSYIREFVYPPRATISEEFVRDMLRCRPFLERETMVLVPTSIWQHDQDSVGPEYPPPKLLFDFTATQASKATVFLNGYSNRHGESLPEKSYVSVPILQVGLPILKNCPPELMAKVMEDEQDAVMRFRYLTKKFSEKADLEELTNNDLQDLFQSIEYEVSRLELQYKNLLRKRQQSLGSVLLSTVGLWLCASIPEEYVDMAKAFFGTATFASGLNYVYLAADTENTMRQSDYYLAWKIWKQFNGS